MPTVTFATLWHGISAMDFKDVEALNAEFVRRVSD